MANIKEAVERYGYENFGYDDPRIYAAKRAFEAGLKRALDRAESAFRLYGDPAKADKFREYINDL